MTSADPVAEALTKLEAACQEFGMPLIRALEEKTDELKVRLFLKCIPNERLKASEREQFLVEVLRRKPSPELLEMVAETERGPRISEDDFIKLELAQKGRCALCGCLLVPDVNPQVDHIIPVALRGKSAISNYQLLCMQCNQGKKKLIGWILGAPFFDDYERLTMRMRYCALARSRGVCAHEGCVETSSTSQLIVVPIIPVAQGGRWIFDNLMSLCQFHATQREREQLESAMRKVHKTKSRDQLFGNLSKFSLAK